MTYQHGLSLQNCICLALMQSSTLSQKEMQHISTNTWRQLLSMVVEGCFATTWPGHIVKLLRWTWAPLSTKSIWGHLSNSLGDLKRAMHKQIPTNINEFKQHCKEESARIHPKPCDTDKFMQTVITSNYCCQRFYKLLSHRVHLIFHTLFLDCGLNILK